MSRRVLALLPVQIGGGEATRVQVLPLFEKFAEVEAWATSGSARVDGMGGRKRLEMRGGEGFEDIA
jgi:hypothetical protein